MSTPLLARHISPSIAVCVGLLLPLCSVRSADEDKDEHGSGRGRGDNLQEALWGDATVLNAVRMVLEGRQIFRFDTYSDEAFWGDTLHLHETLNQLTPRQALALGLKVDAEALPGSLQEKIRKGKIDLDDPAVTLTLIGRKAVLGVVGFFQDRQLRSVGLTCAICHSTVNDSLAPGVGQRLDGWSNHDLNDRKWATWWNISSRSEIFLKLCPGLTGSLSHRNNSPEAN